MAQVGKTGYVYVFDRETGNPLFPIKERPVPPSGIPGERASFTQPVPAKPKPFAKVDLTEKNLNNVSPEAYAKALEIFKKSKSGPQFTLISNSLP